MKKIFFIYLIMQFCFSETIFAQTDTKYKIKKVVIDAGHGGKDPGAIGKISQEKDITLKIALLVGSYIEEHIEEVEVIYTRQTDEFLKLRRRSEIANDNKADLFISIHVNSSKYTEPHGTSTYVMGLNKSDDNLEVAKLENSAIYIESNYEKDYENFDIESPENYIILSLYQNVNLENSLLFASKVQEQFEKRAVRKNLGVKQAGLLVLWTTTMPSVLIETGFISNETEELFLSTEYGQTIVASAIFRAFREYKILIESHSDFTIKKNEPTTEDELIDKYTEPEIMFSIILKSSTIRLTPTDPSFEGIENIQEHYNKGIYKYTVPEVADYDQITILHKQIIKTLPDAYIIAYKNGENISIEQALKEIKK